MANQNTPPLTLALENNLILNNMIIEDGMGVSQGGGVLMFSYKGTYIVRNNIMGGNTAQGSSNPKGGGIVAGWTPEDTIHFLGNTIYGNQAETGGGVYFENGRIANVYNNIVYGNTATEGGDIYLGTETGNGFNNNYSNMKGTWATSGNNLNMDPLFVNPAINDFHLQPGSPMKNAGTSSVPNPPGLPSTDFEGNPRVMGPAPDIGAYEFSPVSPAEGTIGTEVIITGSDFGAKRGKVFLGAVTLKVLAWNDEMIQCLINKPLSPSLYDVTIQSKGAPEIVIPDAFSFEAPQIDSVDPIQGSQGSEVKIFGDFFGLKKGKVILGGQNCKVLDWAMDPSTGESEILIEVPKKLTVGTYDLTVTNQVGSDTIEGAFTVP